MSITASQAYTALRNRLEASGSDISIPLRWHGEDQDALPDTPAAFAYVVFNNDGSGPGPVAFGGGRGANLYRNRVLVEVFVFVPNGEGLKTLLDVAETIAAWLRSFRDSSISCFSADVIPIGEGSRLTPPGLQSAVNNYQCAVVEVDMTFDQTG